MTTYYYYYYHYEDSLYGAVITTQTLKEFT